MLWPLSFNILEASPHFLKFRFKYFYWGADKSLTPPGKKQATATEDF
jgi:hypothetical protein